MFTICIDALDEGGYRVYSKMPEAPMEPGMAEEMPESSGEQVVQSLKEALTVALEALKSGGQIEEANQQEKAFNEAIGAKSAKSSNYAV